MKEVEHDLRKGGFDRERRQPALKRAANESTLCYATLIRVAHRSLKNTMHTNSVLHCIMLVYMYIQGSFSEHENARNALLHDTENSYKKHVLVHVRNRIELGMRTMRHLVM